MKDPREYSLLHGLSDFWTRFFADTTQLEALYAATEVQLAQAYLELMSAFLGISLQDIPLFSKEYFRLITIREDEMVLDVGLNHGQDRYVHTVAVALTQARTLQNKVYQPTNALVETTDFDLDATAYQLRFVTDVTGQVEAVVSTAVDAHLLTFILGAYADLYVLEGTPFASAKEGDWIRLAGSMAGNNRSFRINTVVDGQRVLLEGSPTLPDPGSGTLRVTVISSEFQPATGFARRNLTVETGGSFDDPYLRRTATEQLSWAATPPIGMGVRKGDILHILDQQAVPTAPGDYTIGVVRHDKLHLATATPVPVNLSPHVVGDMGWACTADPVTNRIHLPGTEIAAGTKVLFTTTGTFPGGLTEDTFYYLRDVVFTPGGPYNEFKLALLLNGTPIDLTDAGTGTLTIYFIDSSRSTKLVRDYVVLREPANIDVVAEPLVFAQTGVPKTGVTGEIADNSLHVTGGAPFIGTDRQRFITLSGGGAVIGATCDISIENSKTVLRRVTTPLTTPAQPFARTGAHGTIRITSGTQAGTYVLSAVSDNGDTAELDTVLLTPKQVTVDVDAVTNDGTYQIRSVSPDGRRVYLDQPLTYPDLNSGFISWVVHDGYQASLAHTRIRYGSLTVGGGIGSLESGGYRTPTEDVDYRVDYEAGTLIQIGRLAGTWSLSGSVAFSHTAYRWLMEVFAEIRGAVATLRADDNTVEVNEVAFWAPDVRVDHFHLYDNFGALINRFQPSTEDYRQFIRGVFQLYWLGPTLARIESALNVVCSMPVIRDDGETLLAYDATSDPDHLVVRTQRLNGSEGVYLFPLGTPLRDDITGYVPGTSTTVTFDSFETLTTLFQVTDYQQDPTWWDSIILPAEIMPKETSAWRRTTVPLIYENIVGQLDDPHIGDPGFFIGADEDGNVPAWTEVVPVYSPGTSLAFPFAGAFGFDGWSRPPGPAKRRKMANIVVDKYIKRNLFYVHFDAALSSLFPLSFLNDLRELVLIAKPGYVLAYVEPTSSFTDTLRVQEEVLGIDVYLALSERGVSIQRERPLLIGDFWEVGENFRHGGNLAGAALLVADGISIPAPVTLPHDHLTVLDVNSPGVSVNPWRYDVGLSAWVPKDFSFNYHTGVLTPLTVWPAGTYTVDYSWYVITDPLTADPTTGDTPLIVGGQELYFGGSMGAHLVDNPEEPVLIEQPLQIAVIPV